MAHFALLNANNIVIEVIVVKNEVITDSFGTEREDLGKQFCANLFGGNWIQTSYNNNIRKHYAAIGAVYDPEVDAFSDGPQPYPSWKLNKETMKWEAPKKQPTKHHIIWDEENLKWKTPEGT